MRSFAPLVAALALVAAPAVAHAQAGDSAVALGYRSEAGHRAAWRLGVTTTGELEVTGGPVANGAGGGNGNGNGNGGGAEKPAARKTTLHIETVVDYHTIEGAGEAGAPLVVALGVDRLALRRTENQQLVVDSILEAAGLRRAGGEPQPIEGPLAALVSGAPIARLRLPASGAKARVERLAGEPPAGLDVATLALLLVPALPEGGATATGARWKGERAFATELALDAAAALALDYELTEVKDGRATIAIAGRFERASGRATNARGAGVAVELLRLEAKGEATLDVARGRLLSARLTVEQKTVVLPDGAGEGTRIAATLTTRYELDPRKE